MALPLLLGIEDDPQQLRLIRQELRKRYGNDYGVVCVSTAHEGLRQLEDAAATGREVALLLANLWLPREEGVNFFSQARARHPDARCVALINWRSQAADGQQERAVQLYQALGAGLIDDWIVEPWSAADEHFHQAIGNFLYEWWQGHRPSLGWIRIIGERLVRTSSRNPRPAKPQKFPVRIHRRRFGGSSTTS
jgi:thioredoxin reductase (NADPH)